MSRIKEKLKAILHIVVDNEYAVYTVTVKNGVRKTSSCLISDNASNVFLYSIVDFTRRYIRAINKSNKPNKIPGSQK